METFHSNVLFALGTELTINPGNSYTFKECHPQKAHTAGCIVIKQLENVHATLQRKNRESQGRRPPVPNLGAIGQTG